MNRFGADTDEDVTDWGEVNMEEKRRALPTEEQITRAAHKWMAARGYGELAEVAYFRENWQALPGLCQYVETEVAAHAAAANN